VNALHLWWTKGLTSRVSPPSCSTISSIKQRARFAAR
jgi:hypothetical protein